MAAVVKRVVAIAGYHGFLGEPTLRAFRYASSIRCFGVVWEIRILTTRPGSPAIRGACSSKLGVPVCACRVDYQDQDSLLEALDGVDVLINLIGFSLAGFCPFICPTCKCLFHDSICVNARHANTISDIWRINAGRPDIWDALSDAAIIANVRLYIPSDFGAAPDLYSIGLRSSIVKDQHARRSRELGLKTVQVFCGLFLETTLPDNRGLGFSLSNARVDPVESLSRPQPRVSFTSVEDVGMALMSIASQYRPDKLHTHPDKITISGDAFTFRELASMYTGITGRQVRVRPSTLETFQADDRDISSYLRYAAGYGLLDLSTANHNQSLNPQESVFRWHRVFDRLSINP
ncbi:hypothetical protein EDC01DRAFT_632184 [Geopyxis carbonaria]|nr:hypothetical protein EDC01DRAFT_632184 [Geopyxis carbonaria]